MGREHFKAAHQYVEEPLARRLIRQFRIAAGEHRAVDLSHLRGKDGEHRRERAAQLGKRYAR